ncbi:hypothetical protein HaLaN_09600 [Haematococcus lacustris]|uniref:Uncharacterized protein n=1 Tax=Haematococcus lacustris TaxID=44745 RepID=A0A699Z3Q2_HAELA|nr:hypothetical protein HaLaN_09600 [Haematococcus lacustris]
MAGPAPPGLVP